MKIFITGIAGCLGSNLADRFLDEGHEIFGVDNFDTGSRLYIENQNKIKFFEAYIYDYDFLSKTISSIKPELIIHSAASYKDPNNFLEDCQTNIIGMNNLIKLSLLNSVERFINFQTALCYGHPEYLPIKTNHPLKPFTSYGISKTAGELYLINSELNFLSLRLANICGPRLSIGPIPTFYNRLKNKQSVFCTNAIRDFLDFDDFFSLMQMIISNSGVSGVFNVSTGKGYSVYEIYKLVVEYLNLPLEEVDIIDVADDDVKEVVLDPIDTFNFGWKPKLTDLKEIIFKQLSFYDAHGVDNIFSHLKS